MDWHRRDGQIEYGQGQTGRHRNAETDERQSESGLERETGLALTNAVEKFRFLPLHNVVPFIHILSVYLCLSVCLSVSVCHTDEIAEVSDKLIIIRLPWRNDGRAPSSPTKLINSLVHIKHAHLEEEQLGARSREATLYPWPSETVQTGCRDYLSLSLFLSLSLSLSL